MNMGISATGRPTVQGKPAKIVSPTQERAILGYLDTTRYPHRDRVMFLLSMKAGLRAKEIASLTWAMVTDATGQVGETIHLTGCKFSVAQMLRSSAQIEGNRIRREQGAEKNAWASEPASDTDMRVIARFSGPCAAVALTAHGSVFSHDFKGLE